MMFHSGLYFPPGPNGETFGINKGATEAEVNTYTGGWDIDNTTRLLYVNGDFDPWREASVSADIRPGGPMASTEDVPIYIVPGGFHVSDAITENGEVNAAVGKVQDQIVGKLVEWVGEWDGGKGHGGSGGWGHHHGGPPKRREVMEGQAVRWRG